MNSVNHPVSRRLALSVVSIAALAGCNAVEQPFRQAGDSFRNAITTEGPANSLATVPPVTLKVPNDPGIHPMARSQYTTVITRDVSYDSRGVEINPNARYYRLLFQNLTPASVVVHARVDNGVAGSGVRYQVSYKVDDGANGYQVKFVPGTSTSYQEGLIGRFPVPNFNESDLRKTLSKLQLAYRFEVDSPYNTESVTANFMRRAKPMTDRKGWSDPVMGKVFSTYYVSKLRDTEINYVVQTYPSRNGSKAVITALLTGTETSPNEVDFGILIKEARAMLEEIAKS